MDIRFYNTLTHRVEAFEPLDPPTVTMYNCGPTVYDHAHIGNFRAFVFADVLRRFLEAAGHPVHQVMNITDVGHMTEDQVADGAGQDKMEAAADRLKAAKKAGAPGAGAIDDPADPYQVAAFYAAAFLEDARRLGLRLADDDESHRPRATGHIDAMQRLIAALLERGHAYVAGDGAVYYAVESFPDYGRLSGNTLDKLRGGAGGRVRGAHQAAKRHPGDFLLWKPDATHLMKWPSPWGEGYPGWHVECSAMAMEVLGRKTLDIHTGGEDNIFPHHECEIAQSRGATGCAHFARFWMHTRFLLVEGEKMSKRKGNFYTVRDLVSGAKSPTGRAIDPAVIRFELLRTHYRQNMNFTAKGIGDSARAVSRLRQHHARVAGARPEGEAGEAGEAGGHPVVERFLAALADDLNTSGAIGELFGWMNETTDDPATQAAVLEHADAVLGVLEPAGPAGEDPAWVRARCEAIDTARAAKEYETADRERAKLQEAGYEVRTGPEGTTAERKLS